MKKSLFNNIPTRFRQFREKKLFIDCSFQTASEEIFAHRIVLSHYSNLFKEYFQRTEYNPKLIRVQIPYEISDEFPNLINFFYEQQFSTDMNTDKLMDFYAVSLVYGVSSLSLILKDIIFREINSHNILSIVSHYKNFTYDPKMQILFPKLTENFENMLNSSLDFASFISSNFNRLDTDSILRSLTPKLLSETIRISNFDDTKIVSLIDRYCELQSETSHLDFHYFQDLIKWDYEPGENRSDPYILFSKFNADWVKPSTSRPFISKLLDQRRKTLNSFIHATESVKKFCCNWYAFTWLTEIRESLGQEEIIEIDLMNFIGTLGSSSNYFNPMLYQLIQPYCSTPLQVQQYNRLLFDQEAISDQNKYFLSCPFSPEANTNAMPFVGYLFTTQSFVPSNLKVYFVENKPKPLVLETLGYDEDNKIVYHSPKIDIDPKSMFAQIKVDVVQPVKKIIVRLVGNNSSGGNILRVRQFELHGFFVPN